MQSNILIDLEDGVTHMMMPSNILIEYEEDVTQMVMQGWK